MSLLHREVVVINLQAEANLLELRVRLITASIASLLGRFVLVFSVVHEFCNRRLSVGCNLNQVEARFFGKTQRVFHADNTNLFSSGSHETYLGNSNPLIDARLANEWLLPQSYP